MTTTATSAVIERLPKAHHREPRMADRRDPHVRQDVRRRGAGRGLREREVAVVRHPHALDALADVAVHLNSTVENIGARRLQTVMERVLDEISFTAPDQGGTAITIDAEYVRKHVGDLANDTDLSRYIL